MKARGTTINQAAHEWVNEFNAIPQAIVEKLMKADYDEVNEITPPSGGDRVYILGEEHNGEYGEDCPYVCPEFETWKDGGGR